MLALLLFVAPLAEPHPVVENSVGMKFALLPAGAFTMGSPFTQAGRSGDETAHEIMLTKPFSVGLTEVTQGQYEKVMGRNPSVFQGALLAAAVKDPKQLPVENVSWDDAVEFCRRLTETPEEKKAGRVYRLPTEAEWEFACRAGGANGAFHFGDALGGGDANFHAKYPYGKAVAGEPLLRTAAVASYKPSPAGLFDLHGNVWEWVADKYDRDYYLNGPPKDPVGPRNPTRRVARGGSWRNDAARCRSAYRGKYEPDTRLDNLGFRVVMVPAEPEAEEGK